MSKNNQDAIYVFVKGNKGKFAFIIVEHKFEQILHQSDSINASKDDLNPTYSDWEAMTKSLEYINANKGKDGIPLAPVVTIFTSYEQNYRIANGQSEAKAFKNNFDSLKATMKSLARGKTTIGENGPDDSVKIMYLPDKLKNHMEHVIQILKPKPRFRPS